MMKLAKELTTANSLVNDSESEDEAVLLTWDMVCSNQYFIPTRVCK